MWAYSVEIGERTYSARISDDDRIQILERFDVHNARVSDKDNNRLRIPIPCPFCERYNTDEAIEVGEACVMCPVRFDDLRHGCVPVLRAIPAKFANFSKPVVLLIGFGREGVSWAVDDHREAVKALRILHTFFAFHGVKLEQEAKNEE